jgi:glucose-1-phosphate cytidylyltransferase
MVEIGGRPVLWHIMKVLSQQGIKDFVICTGYKSEIIKNYFTNYGAVNQDFTVTLGDQAGITYHGAHDEFDWTVTVADTGPNTLTGGRIKQIEKYVKGERFLCTYGDGLADIDLKSLTEYHESHGKIATMTSIQPLSRFGVLDLEPDGSVKQFKEKPQVEGWINIGYFLFEPGVFDYLDDDTMLEDKPLKTLAADGEIAAHPHAGFWQPMDTYRESKMLNDLWDSGDAPWKTW